MKISGQFFEIPFTDCHGQNLAAFTIDEKQSDISSVTKLDLRYNDLPTFPVLPKMPKLQQIVLQGNQISSFEKDTFILSPQINMISLQENELQGGFLLILKLL